MPWLVVPGSPPETLLVLAALEADPAGWRHGYGIATETGLRSGTLYPILIRLAGLLGRSAGLLPAGRRDWAQAVLSEAGEVPAGTGRVAWLGGGLWLVAREVLLARVMRVLAFATGAAGLVWIGWPGASSNSATPLNRVYVTGTVVMLALLPWMVRRYFGPVRRGWAPRAARVGAYAMVLALIAAKAAKDRDGSKLGAYFAVIWAPEILLLLVIGGYVAGLLILTSQRMRLTRSSLPIGIGVGAVTGGVLYALAPFGLNFMLFGVDPESSSGTWLGLASLALPLATGFVVARFSARDTHPGVPNPRQQGCLAASCATATAALMLAALTSVMIALFPHQVPLTKGPYTPTTGICPTCASHSAVIPPGLRHEYWVEISVGHTDIAAYATLLIAPFLGAGLGAIGGGLASGRGRGGPRAASPPEPSRPLVGGACGADREKVIDVLKASFAQGWLTKDEFDARVDHVFTSRTHADLAALTADVPGRPRPSS